MNGDWRLSPGSRVLVTGATGFTGQVLVRRLVAGGAHVRAIARPSSTIGTLADVPVDWVRGDVFDPVVVREACTGAQYIVHAAAAYRTAAVRDEVYGLVHVRSTQLLAEAASRTPGFRRLVHVSTIGVHGHIDRPPADERSPFAPGDPYQSTKAEAEQWLARAAPALGIDFAIVRPCAIYGPGDTRLLKVFRMASRGFFVVLGTGRTLYHLIHVEDLAAILERAAVHPAASGEAFIAGADVPIRMDDMARAIGRTLGRRVRIVRLPAAPVFLLAGACEALCRPLGIEPPLYRRRVAFYTKDRAFDTSKLRERLGYACRYSNDEGLAMTARWYAARGWTAGPRS
jgi:nucleoside-diphosphate-sugar epimerase